MKSNGRLIFDESDIVDKRGTFDVMLIRIFIFFGITYEEFASKHRIFMIENGETSSQRVTSDRNNILKLLNRMKDVRFKEQTIISIKYFEKIVIGILKYNIGHIELVLKDIDNNKYVITEDRIAF